MCCQVSGCTQSHLNALDRRPMCARSHVVLSSTLNCSKFPWRSNESDGLGQCGKLNLTWSALNRGLCARSRACSIDGSLGSSAGVLALVSTHSIVVVLNRSSCAIERTNRDHIYLLLNSTI
jgi:hypothetical protein